MLYDSIICSSTPSIGFTLVKKDIAVECELSESTFMRRIHSVKQGEFLPLSSLD